MRAWVALVVIGSLLLAGTVLQPSPAFSGSAAPAALEKQFALRAAMRKLWEDHITWTRLYIVSVAAGLPDTGPTAARLLRNQAEIGEAIKPFYGAAAGDRLSALLKDHILIAAELLASAKAADTTKVNAARARWNANADDIATFLSAANPRSWPPAEMKAMMREHLDLTLEEATARLRGDWAADIAAYDKIHDQILHMADMLSAGIISQFPQQFQ